MTNDMDKPVDTTKTEIVAASEPVAVAVQKESDDICVLAHSPIIYWWPVWLVALVAWLCQAFLIPESSGHSSGLGLAFAATLFFVIFSTTVRLRGANSIIFLLVVVIVSILVVMANLTDLLAGLIAGLDIRMSNGFYGIVFFTIFGFWALMFLCFDRVRYWQVVPGQVKEHMLWGGRERILGNAGAKCHYKSDDFLRHRVLGLFMMGDLEIVNGTERVQINNVFFAKRKTRKINNLIVIRPMS